MSSTDYSSDDSSDRSYDDQGQSRFCPYQTGRFNGHECSEYIDCPAHTARRTGSDGSDDEDVDEDEDETEDEEIDHYGAEDPEDADSHQMAQPEDSPGAQQGEAAPEHGGHSDFPGAGADIIDLTMPSAPQQRQGESSIVGSGTGPGHGNGQTHGLGQPAEVIDLTEDSPEPPAASESGTGAERPAGGRALPTIPASASGSNLPVFRSGATTPAAQRRPATPPSPPPPIRRRTSTNNFGTAPRPSQMAAPRPSVSRRPSELVLPRWQPDAEVTFCPICRTQFSFLIRKHHCR